MSRSRVNSTSDLQAAIRTRATEIYEKSGRVGGRDVQNWCQAEAEILREYAARFERKAIVVNVGGIVYTGEYDPDDAEGYAPGEWKAGDPVPIRFADQKMYLRRPNGQVLETVVVKKLG